MSSSAGALPRVYVSSTSEDLRACREAVSRTLRRLRCDDIAMENYVAEPGSALDRCLADVRSCDLYIGVIGWRYGCVPPGHDRSFVELEYRAAVSAGTDLLIFILDDDAPWPRSGIDPDLRRIEALRAELGNAYLAGLFRGPDDLAAAVATAVARWRSDRRQLPGTVLDPELLVRYHDQLRRRYGRIETDALSPPERADHGQMRLCSVFVEQDTRENLPPTELPLQLRRQLWRQGEFVEPDLPAGVDAEQLRRLHEQYRAAPQRGVLDVVAAPDQRLAVILGDPGSGKSTLARYLVLALAGESDALDALAGHLPVLVELRTLVAAGAPFSGDFLELVDRTSGLAMGVPVLAPYLRSGGQAVVVFDGLDEVFDPRAREELSRQIGGFAGEFPAVRVVVTSRVIGYRHAALADAGFRDHTLQELTSYQIRVFLRVWYRLTCPDRPEEAARRRALLLGAIESSRAIADLAGNPLLLTILAVLAQQDELPRQKWQLYEHASTVLVERWDVSRHLRESGVAADYIDREDKKQLLRRIAYRMQSGADGVAGNLVHGSTLHRVIEDYLVQNYRRDLVEAKRAATVIIEQLRERNFVLSRYGPELYGFVHRSFLEFFCAADIERRFNRDREMVPADLRQLYGAHWADPSWREVLRLLAAELTEPIVGDLIGYLVHEVDPHWLARISIDTTSWRWAEESGPWNIVLAAQCLAELRQPQRVPDAGGAVLDAVALLLESEVDDFRAMTLIEEEILPSIRILGPRWPQRERYLDWYLRRGVVQDADRWNGLAGLIAVLLHPESAEVRRALVASSAEPSSFGYRWGAGLATLVADGHVDRRPFLDDLVATADPDARCAVAEGLAERGAVEELWYLATVDPDDDVLDGAIEAILTDLDPEHARARSVVRERAGTNAHWATLAFDVDALVVGTPEHQAAVARLLAELSDGDGYGRERVLATLTAAVTDPTVWSALWQLVTGERDEGVLRRAVETMLEAGLAEEHIDSALRHRIREGPAPESAARVQLLGYPEDPEALDRVRWDAANAPDENERIASVIALAGSHADDLETVRLARDRAASDTSARVVVTACRVLEAGKQPDLARDLLCFRTADADLDIARATAHELIGYASSAQPRRAVDPQTRAAIRALVRRNADPYLLSVLVEHPVSDPDDSADVQDLLIFDSASWTRWTTLARAALRLAPERAACRAGGPARQAGHDRRRVGARHTAGRPA